MNQCTWEPHWQLPTILTSRFDKGLSTSDVSSDEEDEDENAAAAMAMKDRGRADSGSSKNSRSQPGAAVAKRKWMWVAFTRCLTPAALFYLLEQRLLRRAFCFTDAPRLLAKKWKFSLARCVALCRKKKIAPALQLCPDFPSPFRIDGAVQSLPGVPDEAA